MESDYFKTRRQNSHFDRKYATACS